MPEVLKVQHCKALPRCGKCGVKVAKAFTVPVTRDGKSGFLLTYECHGEQVQYDVESGWMDRCRDTEPLYDEVFSQAVEKVAPEKARETAIRDEVVNEMRERRQAISQFVEQTVYSFIQEQPSFAGDFAEWGRKNRVQLICRYPSLANPSTDIRDLEVKGKTVGTFILPFWPDDTTPPIWTPAP